jgi:phenylacetate-CoA ligase
MKIFPKLEPRYFRQLYYLAQLKRHQWLKEKDLIKIQEKRLKALINHAYHDVPFYHDLFDSEGIKPKDINCVKDLQKIPILTKEIVRKNYPE